MKVLVGLLVAAVVVVGGALLLSGDDGGGDSPTQAGGPGGGGGDRATGGAGDPEQAVLDYLDAAHAGDCGRVVELVTASSLAGLGTTDPDEARAACQAMVDSGDELPGAGVSVEGSGVTANDGSTATVEIVATAGGDTDTVPIPVRNEGGTWKVDLSAMGGSGSSAPSGTGPGAAGPGTEDPGASDN